jgi:tetratricopeptide (TPR) repeat protein
MANEPLELLRKQAQDALSRGQYQEARQIYQQALGYQSDSPDIHYGIATVCFLLGDLHSAMYHFKEVIRLDPLRAGAYINLGAVYNRLEQYDEALTTLRRGIQLDTNRAEGYYNLALVYKQLGQLDMAVNAYREAIRLNARMYDAHYNLANILREKGQHLLAIVHYRQALEIRPKWEKGRVALEAAQAEHAAAQETSSTAAAAKPPSGELSLPRSGEDKIDPERMIDPSIHANYLRDLHEIIIDTDNKSQGMLEFLQKEVEQAIRDLSISILTPKDSKYTLDDQIRRFDDAVVELQKLQEALQKRILRAKLLSEQITKT